MKLLFLSCMAGFACLSCTGVAADVRNLLQNSSFALQTNPNFPDYWAGQNGWQTGARWDVVDDAAVPGTKSVRLSSGDGKKVLLYSGNFGWSPGREGTMYTFSVYLKSGGGEVPVRVGGPRLGLSDFTIGPAWNRYHITAPLKAESGYGGRFLSVRVELAAKGVVFINAPMLTRGEAPSDYAPSVLDARKQKE